MPIYKVDDYAYTILAQKLSTVKGVSLVSVYGQRSYAAHVQVDPGALAARSIGLEDVRNALMVATVNRPKGNLEGAKQVVTLDANDQVFNAAGYRKLIVAYRNGAPVRIEDVANVFDGTQNARTGAWFQHKDVELLAIQREAGANTVQVVDTIKALMPHLRESIPHRCTSIWCLTARSLCVPRYTT
jgi:HAE1 family hydrophobic/amphiphilic exporter-1